MPDTALARIAADCGQTGIKVRVRRPGDAPHEAELPGVRTDMPVLPQVAAAIERVAADLRCSPDVVAVGCSGLTDQDDAAALAALLGFPARVLLTHDSVTAFLGALSGRNGAVVAAGTGVVTLAVGASEVARVDGWGHIMGDAGSGYWIGREALDAVMRAYDGRGEPTELTAAVRERWPDLETAYMQLQSAEDRVRIVAGFARNVALLADRDPIAGEISDRAAAELVRSVIAALDRVRAGDDEELLVAATGGVFQSERIASTFARRLSIDCPRAHLEAASGTGLEGAELLDSVGGAHALHGHISVADTRPTAEA